MTTPTADLVLVRHGQTVWHAENRYAGVTDVALSPRGVKQAARLAAWAATTNPAAVWASPLSRARHTAVRAAEAAGVALRTDDRLRELDFGKGEGLTRADMEHQFPEALQAYERDPVANHLPDGEDPERGARRIVDCLHDIVESHDRQLVLVVAHTTIIRLAICRMIGVPLREYRRLFPFVRNCALTRVRLSGHEAAILEFNSPIDD
jgi:probable phosphoglycerate mutase